MHLGLKHETWDMFSLTSTEENTMALLQRQQEKDVGGLTIVGCGKIIRALSGGDKRSWDRG